MEYRRRESNLHAEALEVILQAGDFAIHAFSFAKRRCVDSSYRRLPDC